jgi:hypothetical protein
MSTATEAETTTALVWPVAAAGLAATLVSPFVIGPEHMLGIAIGAAIGVANLWAIASVVRGLVRGNALPWSVVAAVKFAAVLFVVFIVLKNDWASAVSLAIGYSALPVGIVIGQLGRGNAARREG